MTRLKTFAVRFAIGIAALIVGGAAVLAILSRIVKSPIPLGVTDGRLAPCPPYPVCVSTQSQEAGYRIAPISYKTSLAEAQARVLRIIRSMKRTTIITNDPAYIHAEFRSGLVDFVDDVEFYFDQDAGVIHFRSSARLPYWDWNANRERMEAIRTAFEAETE